MNGTFVPFSTKRPAEEFLAIPISNSSKDGEDPGQVPPAAVQQNACNHAVKREPILELIRDGSRVTHLKITCGCGEVITVECQF